MSDFTDNPDYKENILQEADRITSSDRQDEYGHPAINFARIAILWNAFLSDRLSRPITMEDVAWLMMLTKAARQMNVSKRDNLVDVAGYARCIERIDEYMQEYGTLNSRNLSDEELRTLYKNIMVPRDARKKNGVK